MIKFLGNAAAVVLLMVFSGLWGGYVATVLWGWFVVPQFGLSDLNLLEAIGLLLVVSFFTHQQAQSSDKEYSKILIESYLYAAIKPLIALCAGWVWLQVL